MKTFILLTILVSTALLFLASCRTSTGPTHSRSDQAARRGVPQAYYQKNAEGNFYYADGPGTNTNYHPGVRRNNPVKRN